jgi:hypothetical protein
MQHFVNWICFRPHVRGWETLAALDPLEDGNEPSFQNVFFYVSQNIRQWKKNKNPVIPSVIHHYQNPLESTRIFPSFQKSLQTSLSFCLYFKVMESCPVSSCQCVPCSFFIIVLSVLLFVEYVVLLQFLHVFHCLKQFILLVSSCQQSLINYFSP